MGIKNPFAAVTATYKKAAKYVAPRMNIAKAIKNPEAAIINRGIRESKAYRTIGRPIIKGIGDVAGGAIGGLVTGGPAGAITGATSGLVRAVSNDGNSSGFSLRKNFLQPAVVGAASGYVAGNSGYGQSFNQGFNNARDAGLSVMESTGVGLGRAGSMSLATGMAGSGGAASGLATAYGTIAPMLNQGGGGQPQQGQFMTQLQAPIAAFGSVNPTGGSSNQTLLRQFGGQAAPQQQQGGNSPFALF